MLHLITHLILHNSHLISCFTLYHKLQSKSAMKQTPACYGVIINAVTSQAFLPISGRVQEELVFMWSPSCRADWGWTSCATSNRRLATGDWWWVVSWLGCKVSGGVKNDPANTQRSLTALCSWLFCILIYFFVLWCFMIGDWGHLLTLTLTSDDLESHIVVNVSLTLWL